MNPDNPAVIFPKRSVPCIQGGSRFNQFPFGLLASLGLAALLLISAPAQAATAPALASTEPYAIVSATFSNTAAGTTIQGDLCYTTAPAVAPFVSGATVVPCPAVTGTDQNAARADLISQVCTPIGAAVALNAISIGGGTPGEFPPGCYSSTGAMSITAGTTVTLSGTGVYIFRPGGALSTGANSNVVVAGGACENDVFWAPVGATTVGANANIIGNIFRGTAAGLSITFGDSSSLIGRALAFGSTVTSDNTTFAVPDPCAEPATITVNKDFIPNSTGTVPVALTCTSGTVSATPLNASEAQPAVFTVTGASVGATCTATETVPGGYTADQANCVGVALGGNCTITNTLNSDTVVVNKDFIPNSTGTVPVTLTCTSGTVTATPLNASEALPAVFTVTGASAGATCTATETVPVGYTANQADCVGVPLGGSCEITNTLNSDTVTVSKDFIPNSTGTVPVALTCTSGTVTATPLNAAEGAPAVFTVTGASAGATCTATETVPGGYTANQADCVAVPLGGSCGITNTLNSDTITVSKDFIPNSSEAVPVVLTCTSGTVTTTPLNASEALPAVFTVTGASPGATCTATETVPGGYTANQADCVGVPLGGSCEMTNTLNEDTIVVNKDFIPNSTATVPVALTCTSGTVTATPLNASEALPAVFTVTGASAGATCTATETAPSGYTAQQGDCIDVALGESCTITNTLNEDTIVVNKDFSPNSLATVPVALTCTSGTVTATPLNASEALPAVFTVTGASAGATCTATETVPDGYTANQADCVAVPLGGSCEITNTLNEETIVVNKDFIPNSSEAVPVALTCTSGSVTTTPLNASETLPAVFTVTGASAGATCTATETVPGGYTAQQGDCIDVALGASCTITNTVNSDTIVVNKDFSPNSLATVPVALTCTSGTVTATPLDAAEGAPAVFTVTGASAGATCTATETVPGGYTANQADCVAVPLGGSCIIRNSLDSNTITVNKDFSPNSLATVPVALTCTSGTVTATPLNAAEGAPAVFTVTGASAGATCTATETVPIGYTANQANCVDVALGGSCEITNTLNSDTIVVNKDFIPNSSEAVPVALTCTSGTVTATPLNAAEGAPAVFTVTGASVGATCTATETVPIGYTAQQGDCIEVALGASCTLTNTLDSDTIVVNKDFIPNSTGTVPVALTCTSGTVTATPLNAAEGAPAVFTVTGASAGATCTATETVPGGYTAKQADCVAVPLGGSCEITNTLDSDTIVVNKDFIPNSTGTVPVALTCTSGTVTTTPLNASEALPAVFTVTGASPGATCTATETVPGGYTAKQTDCVAVPLGGSCEITNTLNADTVVVNKDFSPNSLATVPVALTCTSGTVTATPLNAAEGAPAVFKVTGASVGATCTATETVPGGYTANQANCIDVALGGSCEITNTLNSDRIVVSKDFSPNSLATVPVALTCTSGTVTTTPLNAAEGAPAVFTVTGASPGATCTATETVPGGYTANQANCVDVALGGSCEITNTLDSNTIVVNKDFSPNSSEAVPVALTCTSGTVTTTPLNAAEGAPAVFTVTGASVGATCTATETVPGGYMANQADCVGVPLGGSCEITNTLNRDTITVRKDFIPDSTEAVPVALTCTSGTVTATPLNASEALPAVFTVTGASVGATCTATETVPGGYAANQADCVDVPLGGSCEIINTVFFQGIEGIPTLGHAGKAILVLLLLLAMGLVGFRRFG